MTKAETQGLGSLRILFSFTLSPERVVSQVKLYHILLIMVSNLLSSLCLLSLAAVPGIWGATPNTAFWYQLHDGVSRVEALTDANFNETLANSAVLVVWYRLVPPDGTMDPVEQNMAVIYENMLQVSTSFWEILQILRDCINFSWVHLASFIFFSDNITTPDGQRLESWLFVNRGKSQDLWTDR